MKKKPEVTAVTRRKIMDSFWVHYMSTPIEKITISSITKSAGIHRSTFYEYFKDIYDVLEQIENELLEQLEHKFLTIVRQHVHSINDNDAPADLNRFIDITLTFFTEYSEQIYRLSCTAGDPSFRRKLFAIFKTNFMVIHKIPENSHYADYLSSFVFAIILNALKYWWEHKDSISIQEITVLTYKAIGEWLSNHFFYKDDDLSL